MYDSILLNPSARPSPTKCFGSVGWVYNSSFMMWRTASPCKNASSKEGVSSFAYGKRSYNATAAARSSYTHNIHTKSTFYNTKNACVLMCVC
eukprot:m.111747 g.111747  ORF g.111747 m.111747 type:complete len:92 (+) comp9242_c0_seq10:843-1118(+)